MNTELLKTIVQKIGTPVFIYSQEKLRSNVERITSAAKKAGLENRTELYAAYFCNSNPHLFKALSDYKIGILLQTEEEYHQVFRNRLNQNLMLSPSFLSSSEIDFWVKKKIPVNLASLEEVDYFTQKYPNESLRLRLDLTEEENQRMAIKRSQLEKLTELLKQRNIKVYSFHVYAGTGSALEKMEKYIELVLETYKKYFPDTKLINLGGGFQFDYEENESKHFSWQSYFEFLAKKLKEYEIGEGVRFILEPGRDLFADTGIQLLSVKRVIDFGKGIKSVSTNGSYVYMPSATIRARQHKLEFYNQNLQPIKAGTTQATLSGCATLSSDYVFPGNVIIPDDLASGDYIAVQDVGAYCATQHMEFLNKRPCPEVLIKDNKPYLITERGRFEDRIRYLTRKPKKL